MHGGRIAGELLPAAVTERAIGLLMAGVPQPAEPERDVDAETRAR
jgi:hypothetical protein